MRNLSAPGALGPAMVEQTTNVAVESFGAIEKADLGPFLERVGDARVVLLGEMTHGTSEFYRMRARITMELVREKGFDVVGLEADWPDAGRVDQYVRARPATADWTAFARWPPWMWRNDEFRRLVEDLRAWNTAHAGGKVQVCGLDLYSVHTSIAEVLSYLGEHASPEAVEAARARYACLTRWEDPAEYGAAATRALAECEEDVVAMLRELLEKRVATPDGEELFDAQRNAALVRGAEQYYRSMYQGRVSSWNLRDTHMADTLEAVLEHRGPDSKAVVWAHNSHVGDAAGSEMGRRGETTLGSLCRERWRCRLVGQFTDRGTVVAASAWDAPGQVMDVTPSRRDSHGATLASVGPARFLLPLDRAVEAGGSAGALTEERLERAIGVVYRAETERYSHHFGAVLPQRFDEVVWFDTTRALTPLPTAEVGEVPDTYPFAV